MTLLIGILCAKGVVVASDSAATLGSECQLTIGQQQIQKVQKLNKHILYCATGAVGISQIIADHVRTLWESRAFSSKTADMVMQIIGFEINKLVAPYLQTAQFQKVLVGGANSSLCKSLIAMPVAKKPHLFQFDFNGAPERCSKDVPFVALGSGQAIADPFLAFLRRLLWPSREPTLSEGRLAAIWTISHVCRTNPGGVGGPTQLATLTSTPDQDSRIDIASPEDVSEHLQKVSLAEQALVKELTGEDSDTAPPLPSPPKPPLS